MVLHDLITASNIGNGMVHHISLVVMLTAVAAPQPGAEQPTVEEIIASLQKTEARIENLSVTTKLLHIGDMPVTGADGQTRIRRKRIKTVNRFVVDRAQRIWFEGRYEFFKGKRLDEVSHVAYWTGTDNGNEARKMRGQTSRYNVAEIERGGLSHFGINPLEFTTHFVNAINRAHLEFVSQILTEDQASIVETKQHDQRTVIVLETKPQGVDKPLKYRGQEFQSKFQFWIDPERNVAVRRSLLVKQAEKEWREVLRGESSGYREVIPNIWLPLNVHKTAEVIVSIPDAAEGKISELHVGFNKGWKVNQRLAEDVFELTFTVDPSGNR